MLVSVQTVSFAVATVSAHRGWMFGTLHEGTKGRSPLAPWVDTHKAIAKAVKKGELQTTMGPFLLPLRGSGGPLRDVASSVLTDFLSMNTDSKDSIVHFVRRFGVFRYGDLEIGSGAPEIIRSLWRESEGAGKRPFAFSVKSFWNEHARVDLLSRIATVLHDRDSETAAALLPLFDEPIRLVSGASEHAEEYSDPLHNSEQLLAAAIAVGLKDARFSPVEVKGIFTAGVVTGCVLDAIYLRLMAEITEGHVLRGCRYSKCGNVFVPSRSDQVHCSRRCQNLAARYRQLEKQSRSKKHAKRHNR